MIFISKLTEADKGALVLYIPGHARNWLDPECELGIISSWNEHNVFVKFQRKTDPNKFQITAAGCKPTDLVWKTHDGIASDAGENWVTNILYR